MKLHGIGRRAGRGGPDPSGAGAGEYDEEDGSDEELEGDGQGEGEVGVYAVPAGEQGQGEEGYEDGDEESRPSRGWRQKLPHRQNVLTQAMRRQGIDRSRYGSRLEASEYEEGIMKAVFEALANYKAKVDDTVLKLVENLGEEKLLTPTGAYFPTVYAQLKHIFGSDVNWIKRLKAAMPGNAALAGSRFADYDLEALKSLPMQDRARFFKDMRDLDRDASAFVASLGESDFAKSVSYKNYHGQTETRALWQALMQWFNHGTHHRGTISGQLDAMGVENDYSSFIASL
jgi:uncharacterized damage-inducible protein DinB